MQLLLYYYSETGKEIVIEITLPTSPGEPTLGRVGITNAEGWNNVGKYYYYIAFVANLRK